MPSIYIQTNQLSKYYGEHLAVKNINLQIKEGEIFGFLGPNGAGKTTTIKMMVGLLEPTEGYIELKGIDMWKDPIKAKEIIAYVPDQPTLYPKLTGFEYLQFVAEVFQLTKEQFNNRTAELLDIFSLTGREHDLIENYSHGMRQKIAISGAIIHRPHILFLDEPTVGLDPKSARNLKDLLQTLSGEGMTTFVSTHILEIAEQMCHRIGIITEGKMLALGTIDELRERGGQMGDSLEDIFLQLTGDEQQQAIIDELSLDNDSDNR